MNNFYREAQKYLFFSSYDGEDHLGPGNYILLGIGLILTILSGIFAVFLPDLIPFSSVLIFLSGVIMLAFFQYWLTFPLFVLFHFLANRKKLVNARSVQILIWSVLFAWLVVSLFFVLYT